MSSESNKQLPQVKVALFGPINSGKTTFLYTLQNKDASNITSTKEASIVGLTRTFYRVSTGKKIPLETYKLIIVDLPGSKNYENIRVVNLSKCTGAIFFYDVTDPNSPRILKEMIRNEIIDGGLISNILGVVLVGVKKDIGVNKDAIVIAKEIEEILSKEIMRMWNYKIPHVLINALDKREVEIVLNILESLLMSLSIPEDLVKALSIDKIIKEIAPIQTPQRPLRTTEQPVTETHPEPAVETKIKIKTKEIKKEIESVKLRFELFPVDRIWQILSELGRSFEEIESLVLVRKASDELVYVAFYPGEKIKENIPEDLIKLLMETEFSINNLVKMMSDVGDLSHVILYGSEKSIIFVRKKAGLLAVKTYSRPSNELLELLLK